MQKIRLTKKFTLEMSHVLTGYNGKCKNIHGHSYILYVTIIGKAISDKNSPKLGMVMDFRDIKEMVNGLIIDRFDHTLVLNADSDLVNIIHSENYRVEIFNFQPTSENLLCYFAQLINEKLNEDVKLHSLRLHETADSFAEWYASDN